MYKMFVKLSTVIAAAAMVLVMGLSGTSIAASTAHQATMAATSSMMQGACPVGLASQMSAMMATEEPAMTSTEEAGMTTTQDASMMGTETAMGPMCLVAKMSGAEEVPPGDPKGTGFAAITIDPVKNEVTFDVVVSGIKLPASAMHIHVGEAGKAGDVVVPAAKAPDASGAVTSTTANVDPALIAKILDNPAGYYINVHNADFPKGAVRGQLMDITDSEMSATMEATMSQ